MAQTRILLYYLFTPIADPQAVRLWQWNLCERLGLRGRILISEHGINGTVGGELKAVKAYQKATKEYEPFRNIEWKISEGTGLDENGHSLDFPRLSVKVRKEIVAFGAADELKGDRNGVIDGGRHVKPEDVENVIEENPDLVFFDGRNAIEAEVGRFDGAIVPPTNTTHDFIKLLDSGTYDHLKDTPILTYCTGGIRCEVLTSVMKNRGFTNVMQLDGGIVRYAEKYGNKGRWRGALDFGEDPEVIGRCHKCAAPTSLLHNCDEPSCRARLVTCENCGERVLCEEHADADISA